MSENNIIEINNTIIHPGSEDTVNLSVGKLPVGHRIYIKVNVYNAPEPGPVILLMGGLHGDEINGVEVLRRAISSGMFSNLTCGAVVAVSLLNVYGFINFSRDLPDGKDVNRSFPGNSRGSLASRIAAVVSRKILPVIDLGIDLHTGAANRYNYPQIRFNRKDPHSKELAEAFNAPIMFEQNTIAKSLRKTAKTLGKQILVYEGGESLRLDEYSIKIALDGIQNILIHHQMIQGDLISKEQLVFKRTAWVRASVAGIFNSFSKSGQYIQRGVPIGSISDPYGDHMHIVSAVKDGFIIGHNNIAVVNQGDALFHVAYH